MDKFVFTFVPGGGYFLQGAKGLVFYDIPGHIEQLLHGQSRTVDHVKCLTFGDSPDVFFMSYIDIRGITQFVYQGLPQALVNWIETPQHQIFQRDHSLRVELGPNGSFFAWDRSTYRWANLPPLLEATIQNWIRVGGWVEGPPELVSLGYAGSFYIRTDRKSAWVADISDQLEPALYAKFQDYQKTGVEARLFHSVTFNKYVANEFVAMDAQGNIDYIVPEPIREHIHRNNNGWNTNQEDFGAHPQFGKDGWSKEGWGDQGWNTGGNAGGDAGAGAGAGAGGNSGDDEDSNSSEHNYPGRRKPRKRGGRRRGRGWGETPQEQRQRQAEEQRQRQQRDAYLKAQYFLWKAECDRSFARGQRLNTFPAPPLEVSTCELVACKNRKIESGLWSCVHDMETLLRASGEYSFNWLKKQALNWHPDRIGQKAEPEFRAEANKKATEMFSIFQELIENQKGGRGR